MFIIRDRIVSSEMPIDKRVAGHWYVLTRAVILKRLDTGTRTLTTEDAAQMARNAKDKIEDVLHYSTNSISIINM